MAVDLSNYTDVNTRHRMARETFPELRIVESDPHIIDTADGMFVAVTVTVHRTPDDPLPTRGTAWEPLPGKTAYTRDSEMMNAATSALGRALGYMGFGTAHALASADEVKARTQDDEGSSPAPRPRNQTGQRAKGRGPDPTSADAPTMAQTNMIRSMRLALGNDTTEHVAPKTKTAASILISELQAQLKAKDTPR